jgi:hypothetical protein
MQLGGVDVDLISGQAEDFASAQAENEDQDEGRIERFVRVPGRLKEPSGVVDSPCLRLASLTWCATARHLDSPDRVTTDYLVIDRTGQRGAERVTRVFTASRGQRFVAAFPYRAAVPLRGIAE